MPWLTILLVHLTSFRNWPFQWSQVHLVVLSFCLIVVSCGFVSMWSMVSCRIGQLATFCRTCHTVVVWEQSHGLYSWVSSTLALEFLKRLGIPTMVKPRCKLTDKASILVMNHLCSLRPRWIPSGFVQPLKAFSCSAVPGA